MSEKKFAAIQLKPEFKEKRSVSIGAKTVRAEPGKPVRIELEYLDAFLKTGKFDRVDEPAASDTSDLPQDLPARSTLVREGKTVTDINELSVEKLEEINGIGPKLAVEIYAYFHPSQDENNGGTE